MSDQDIMTFIDALQTAVKDMAYDINTLKHNLNIEMKSKDIISSVS